MGLCIVFGDNLVQVSSCNKILVDLHFNAISRGIVFKGMDIALHWQEERT